MTVMHSNIVFISVVCIVCLVPSVLALPLNSKTNNISPESKADEFHLFPAWVAEIGEVFLIVLDFVWHHQLVEEIQHVGHQVEEVDAKIDALLSTSPGASQMFKLRKSYQQDPSEWPTPPIERNEDDKLSKFIQKLTWALGLSFSGAANWVAPFIG